jgi:glycine cleavage system aminomethyltransferase T
MEYGLRLWDTLWEAGQSEGMVAAGYRAIDSLRLEKGYRYWSGEISPDYTPLEAGLGFAVNLDKGDFIGREAILKQKAEGIKTKLICISLEDTHTIVLGNEPLRFAGSSDIIGWVTSGGYGYTVGKSIAYGYLPVAHSKAGTRLTVECFGEEINAIVEKEPLFDPKGERIKK